MMKNIFFELSASTTTQLLLRRTHVRPVCYAALPKQNKYEKAFVVANAQ